MTKDINHPNCLAIRGCKDQIGQPLGQSTCTVASAAQILTIIFTHNVADVNAEVWFYVRTATSGLCLEVDAGDYLPFKLVKLNTCNISNWNQQFAINLQNTSKNRVYRVTNSGSISSRQRPDLCLNVIDASPSNGALIQMSSCNYGTQTFTPQVFSSRVAPCSLESQNSGIMNVVNDSLIFNFN
jgi:hypothetical protein